MTWCCRGDGEGGVMLALSHNDQVRNFLAKAGRRAFDLAESLPVETAREAAAPARSPPRCSGLPRQQPGSPNSRQRPAEFWPARRLDSIQVDLEFPSGVFTESDEPPPMFPRRKS
jgi:hypothetical protein